ncbi:MAG: response regulator transcription factor [Lachnospiraceae bacterium]|nr:response regulator transcription factor [Lachnospiraceae bacterium]
MKILLAEDTVDLNRAVAQMLRINEFTVDCAYDGEEALSFISENGYDGIVLDIMMPKKSGLEVLAEMRAAGNATPVLLLTAKSEVDDRVTGLDAGADDYLTKPFAMKELLARMRALTRRSAVLRPAGDLTVGDLTLSADTLEIRSDSSIRLSSREFALLHCLATESGQSVSDSTILQRIWSGDETADPDTVLLYVNYLRTKLFSVGSRARIDKDRDGAYCLILP